MNRMILVSMLLLTAAASQAAGGGDGVEKMHKENKDKMREVLGDARDAIQQFKSALETLKGLATSAPGVATSLAAGPAVVCPPSPPADAATVQAAVTAKEGIRSASKALTSGWLGIIQAAEGQHQAGKAKLDAAKGKAPPITTKLDETKEKLGAAKTDISTMQGNQSGGNGSPSPQLPPIRAEVAGRSDRLKENEIQCRQEVEDSEKVWKEFDEALKEGGAIGGYETYAKDEIKKAKDQVTAAQNSIDAIKTACPDSGTSWTTAIEKVNALSTAGQDTKNGEANNACSKTKEFNPNECKEAPL